MPSSSCRRLRQEKSSSEMEIGFIILGMVNAHVGITGLDTEVCLLNRCTLLISPGILHLNASTCCNSTILFYNGFANFKLLIVLPASPARNPM
ncbi:hypothetical protein H5410_024941 [Solanum commersonii]|uniref:Uncharacterized protein n=1 Tax=Solanum commersonii TaxID=4109 RepID=A0A9J5ZNH9_SOLCO|nr:hypothetical protein H5410_024941 [Solanum commersonii]